MNYLRNIFIEANRILAAKICFVVFFSKMLISATPMFVDVLDKGTILMVVLQVELELASNNSNSNNEDLHDHGGKIFHTDHTIYLSFNPTIENISKQKNYSRNEKLISFFNPRVPTPPPNIV